MLWGDNIGLACHPVIDFLERNPSGCGPTMRPVGRVPLDRNGKGRIMICARAWSAKHKQPSQHQGPFTRATIEVLDALLWGFHNAQRSLCCPSYEEVARRGD